MVCDGRHGRLRVSTVAARPPAVSCPVTFVVVPVTACSSAPDAFVRVPEQLREVDEEVASISGAFREYHLFRRVRAAAAACRARPEFENLLRRQKASCFTVGVPRRKVLEEDA